MPGVPLPSGTASLPRRRGYGIGGRATLGSAWARSFAGVAGADDVGEDDEQDGSQSVEDFLETMESKKLHGLSLTNRPLDSFERLLDRGTLNLTPRYQRQYIWKRDKASRLVATVLCSRYVSPVVLHEKSKGGQQEVVDGKQRLISLLSWMLSSTKTDPSVVSKLRAQGIVDFPALEFGEDHDTYKPLEGLMFSQLTVERQNAYRDYMIGNQMIPYDTKKTDVFEVWALP